MSLERFFLSLPVIHAGIGDIVLCSLIYDVLIRKLPQRISLHTVHEALNGNLAEPRTLFHPHRNDIGGITMKARAYLLSQGQYLTVFRWIVCSLLLLLTISTHADAQWSWNPAVNNTICTALGNQEIPRVCSDGSGGAIITWRDARGGNQDDIYIQKINTTGTVLWSLDGVPLCTATGEQDAPQVCPDGSGGAIVVWEDGRPGSSEQHIYAQRISSSGSIQWTTNGTAICIASGYHSTPQICSDGSGGAIVSWVDGRAGRDIYAQRVNGSGTIQWNPGGIVVCDAPDYQGQVQICSDANGGAIIAWQDGRVSYAFDIYAQRVNAGGIVQWTTNGTAICTASGAHGDVQISEDGSGGAILTWTDGRSMQPDIYAQRINASGAIQWALNGIAVSAATGRQQFPVLCTDNVSGAIIAWQDIRGSSGIDIYAQRINDSGVAEWTTNGVDVCIDQGNDFLNDICGDGNGGAILVWQDYKADWDVSAQRMDASGIIQWKQNGEAVTSATGVQTYPVLCGDGSGGAIVTWNDDRGSDRDIYASKVLASGALFPVELRSFSAQRSGSSVSLSWETATETSNHGFELERKTDDQAWATIAFILGHGTSTAAHTYQYSDPINGAHIHAKFLRYRLKQIDMDGRYEYSPEVEVQLDVPQPRFALEGYPTPCNQVLAARLTIGEEGAANIHLHDITGRVVMAIIQDAILPAGSHSIQVGTANVPSGLYLLVVENQEGRRTEKVLIRH